MIKTHIEKLLTSHPTPLYVFDIGTLLDRIAFFAGNFRLTFLCVMP